MKCAACGKKIRTKPGVPPLAGYVKTSAGNEADVGMDCLRKIIKAGKDGYQAKPGGLRFFA